MRRTVLTYGLIAGAILAASMVLALPFRESIGFDRSMVFGYTTMVIAFLMVYFGVRSYRDKVAGGKVSFGRALSVGLLITVVATACYVATWEVIYFKVTPDFDKAYAAYTIEKARQSGASEQEIAAKAAEMAKFSEMYQNPFYNAAVTFLEPLPVGLLFSLIAAGTLSRRRRPVGAGAVLAQ